MTDETIKLPTKEELLDGKDEESTSKEPEQKQASTEAVYSEVEQEALKQGWKPKDQWDGDPEQHRSAREYLDRGELLGKIKSQNGQLDEIKRVLGAMSEQNKKVYQAGYERALNELKAQRKEAMKEGDFDAVEQIEEKIDDHKEAIRTIKQQPASLPGPSTTTIQWLQENPWYAKDKVMRRVADGMAIDYVGDHRSASEEAIYEYIDKQLRKEFPDKFQRKSAPDPDSESRHVASRKPNGGATSFDKLLDSMTDDQRNIAKTLVKNGAISKEDYVKQYNQMMGS